MKLQIKGSPRYVKRMYKHLREHPTTKKTMEMEDEKDNNSKCHKQLGMRL